MTAGICSTETRVSVPAREMQAICFFCPIGGVVWIVADMVRVIEYITCMISYLCIMHTMKERCI